MGVMDKFLTAMKLTDSEDDYEDEDLYEEDEEEFEEKPKKFIKSNKSEDEEDVQEASRKSSQKVTPIRQVKRSSGNEMNVCMIKPSSVEEAKDITDTLLANRTVILNLENLDYEISQRIIDFASGSTYAINGNLQKISNFIFIITPASVNISGDFQEILSGTFDVPSISRNDI